MKHHPDAGQRQILAAIEAERALLMDAARPEAMKRLAERGRRSKASRAYLALWSNLGGCARRQGS